MRSEVWSTEAWKDCGHIGNRGRRGEDDSNVGSVFKCEAKRGIKLVRVLCGVVMEGN